MVDYKSHPNFKNAVNNAKVGAVMMGEDYDELMKYRESKLTPAECAELAQAKRDGRVVEVVRCKDCVHHHIESYGEKWCGRFDGGMGLSENDYCSYGQPREAAVNALKEREAE